MVDAKLRWGTYASEKRKTRNFKGNDRKEMKSRNYRKLIRKASRWAPGIVMAAAVFVTIVHGIITASLMASANTKAQELQKKFDTEEIVNNDLKKAEKDANYKYNSVKSRGDDLIKLEKQYAGYQQKANDAASDDEKKKNESARDDVVKQMKKYFDDLDQTNAMLWYAGDPDSSHWKCSTVYDFSDSEAKEPVIFTCVSDDNKLLSYMTALFDRDKGTFSDVSLYTTYAGQEKLTDDDGNYIYNGAWNDVPSQTDGSVAENFASMPSVLWNVVIADGNIYPGYTDEYDKAVEQVQVADKAREESADGTDSEENTDESESDEVNSSETPDSSDDMNDSTEEETE